MLLRQVQADPLQGHHLRQVRRRGHALEGPPRADGPHPAGQPGQPHLVLQGHPEPARASCSTSARATSSASSTSRCTSSPTSTRTRASAPWRAHRGRGRGSRRQGRPAPGRARGRAQAPSSTRPRTSSTPTSPRPRRTSRPSAPRGPRRSSRPPRTVEAPLAALKSGVAEETIAFAPTGEVDRRRRRQGRQGSHRAPAQDRRRLHRAGQRELQQREADEARAVEQKIEDLRAAMDETAAPRARAASPSRPRASRTSCASCATSSKASSRCRRSARTSTARSTSATARAPRVAASSAPGMGAEAVREIISRMDLEELARSLHVEVRTSSGQRRKKAIKRLRLIEAFRRSRHPPGLDDPVRAAGHPAGPPADGPARRRPLRDLRPQRPLPPRHQPQQPAQATARAGRPGDHHPQREADAPGGVRRADRQRPSRPRDRRYRQPPPQVAVRHAQGQAGPVPPEPARQARRLLGPLGHRRRPGAQAPPVRAAQEDGARAVQAVRHAPARREGLRPQHQERQAHRRARPARGLGRPRRGHQGPPGPAEPRPDAAPPGHPGVHAGPRRGLGHPDPPARLHRVQRGLRRRPDGGPRAALDGRPGRGADDDALDREPAVARRRQPGRGADPGHGPGLLLPDHGLAGREVEEGRPDLPDRGRGDPRLPAPREDRRHAPRARRRRGQGLGRRVRHPPRGAPADDHRPDHLQPDPARPAALPRPGHAPGRPQGAGRRLLPPARGGRDGPPRRRHQERRVRVRHPWRHDHRPLRYRDPQGQGGAPRGRRRRRRGDRPPVPARPHHRGRALRAGRRGVAGRPPPGCPTR